MSSLLSAPFRLRSFCWLGLIFALLCLPLLLSNRESNYTYDETNYHLPAVRQIREHWPRLDLQRDCFSAAAPGYHYMLAGLSFVTTTNRLPLRLVNFAVSLGVLALLWRAWPAGAGTNLVTLALLPLAASNFFVKSASYLVTDNAALLMITGALTALFFAPAAPGLRRASGFAAAAVFIRQSGIWLVAPLGIRILREPFSIRRLLLLLPPLLILSWLFFSWGGLVPAAWRDATRSATGLVPAAGAYLLAVLGLLGTAYYAAARPADWSADLRSRWAGGGALAGLALALAGTTTFSFEDGRWGGYLWDAAARLPAVGPYSAVFLVLTPFGGALLAVMVRQLWLEAGTTAALGWSAAFIGWAGTGLTNRLVFHRYFEPITLVLLICWLLLLIRTRPAPAGVALRPLAILGVFQLALTLITAHGRTFGFL